MNVTVSMNLKWFENHLANRQQYITINQEGETIPNIA